MRYRFRFYGILCASAVLIFVARSIFCRGHQKQWLTAADIDRFAITNQLDSPKHRTRIPRIIHQTWKTKEVPERWNKTVQSVIEANAHRFQYRLWTNEDVHRFVEEKDPKFYRETFLSYSMDIQRVDAFRYFVLYHQGGIYIDMDNGGRQPLNTLLNALELIDPQAEHYSAFPQTNPIGVSNDLMIATPGHPLFRQLINDLSFFNRNFFIDYLTVMLSAGPLYLSLHEYYFTPFSSSVGVRVLDEIVYSSMYIWHTPGNSWHRRDAKVILFIYKIFQEKSQWLYIYLPCFLLVLFIYHRWGHSKFSRRIPQIIV